MAFASNFDNHMKKALTMSVPKLTWKPGWSPKGYRWKVDLAGLDGKDDPAANVIKIWHWARDPKNTKGILFVQGFSKLYWQTKVRLRQRAEFVGERMAEAGLHVDYKPTKIRYRNKNGRWVHFRPKTGRGFRAKEGAGRLRLAAQGLAKDVARLVRSTQRQPT
jgi:hypothetical protein